MPEDRTDPTGRQVVLAVAIFPPQSGEESRPPLVYLEGGPGGEILEAIPFAYSTVIEPLNADRSVVVFDQRGTGYSEPSLACPETEQLTYDLLDDLLETEELTQRRLDALAPCQARWAAEGIDLGQYNSAASAADVDDIRRALGYQTWDLYGVSYGTRLALTIMRDHPDGIRSVVLDSTYAPEVDGVASIPETADRALNELCQACVADTGCSAAYGDIESLLFEVIALLNDEPVQISVGDLFTGDRYAVVLDGDSVLDLVFQSLYSEELLIAIPEMLADIRDGRNLKVEFLVALVLANQRFFAIGQNFSVQCNEEVAFADPAAVDAATQRFPQLASLVEGAFTQSAYAFEFCALWGAGVGDAIEAEPVFSDIPTLVVAGQFDPITPPSFGRAVADRLENSYFVEYPGLGHGVAAVEGCPISVTLSFLDDPTIAPDVSCAASMPPARFTVYLDDTAVELVEVAVNLLGEVTRALVPASWEDLGFGAFYRSRSGTDETALLVQGYRGESILELVLELFGSELSPNGVLEEVESLTMGGRVWRRFTDSAGLRVEVALWAGDGSTLAVALISDPRDASNYYTSVFIPALESIQLLP